MIATRIGYVNEDTARGVQVLYRLSPAMVMPHRGCIRTRYVVSSAATAWGMDETYLFAANEHGTITSWRELPGSEKGVFSPDTAVRNAGYDIVDA